MMHIGVGRIFFCGAALFSSKKLTTFFSRRPQNTGYNYQINHSQRPDLPNFLKNGLLLYVGCIFAWGCTHNFPCKFAPSLLIFSAPWGAHAPSAAPVYADAMMIMIGGDVVQVTYSSESRPGASSLRAVTAVDGSTTQFQACSLSPASLYRFVVSASTRAGLLGPPTMRSYWTEASAPPVPPAASLTDVTSTTVKLLLQPITSTPTLPTSIITYFIVVDHTSNAAAGRMKRQLDNSNRYSLAHRCKIFILVTFFTFFNVFFIFPAFFYNKKR